MSTLNLHKTLVHSALALTLVLKIFDLLASPALAARSGSSSNLGLADLASLGQPASAQANAGQCPSPVAPQASLPTQVASTQLGASFLAQMPPVVPGGSCPADFTSIPCGTGSELFCEVGGVTDNPVGGGILAPLAPLAAAGGGFPIAALAPLAGIPFAFTGGGGGRRHTNTTFRYSRANS